LKTALFSIFGVTLKRAKMKALTRANSRETSSGVRKRHFLATDEISVRLKKFQMVFGSFATFFILLGGLVILTYTTPTRSLPHAHTRLLQISLSLYR
jgi:hypothetical protein